ncbi:uncharacterized protein FA14DRAFT_72927 [Meira miltonrushii]|uniref:Uncharacterized protein n=1 Tax=Meira miltonrushii TaxID=1280837 RepID=A0A316VA77_9BASI|nr:uncharacterized protein FA14DRAFT_72927 [Meira miltonrushii]PWN34477.1 hypothetical protein FA14DRAFT_72927 [Meira miltonrushii]
MMAFAPPHKEHNSILTNIKHSNPTSYQMDQSSRNHANGLMNRTKYTNRETKDDLHSSRPGVFSPPPRPIRSNVRPAAEVRATRTKAENAQNTPNIDEERVGEAIVEEDQASEDEEEGENKINPDQPYWTERSMSLDEAKSLEQQKSINALRTNRPRLDSAPSGTGSHYRSRSHFSIPDIAITSADEEGNEVRYELQLEQAKRRLILCPSRSGEDEDYSTSQAQNNPSKEDKKQKAKAPATNKAKAQLAMFTFPTSASSATSSGKKKTSKTSSDARAPPSINIVNAEGQSRILEASEAAKYPLPLSPTSPSSQRDSMQEQQRQMIMSASGSTATKEQVNESVSAPVMSSSKFGKRLRKSSLPNLFGKKERDAAHAAAMQIMPSDADPVGMTGSSKGEDNRDVNGQHYVGGIPAMSHYNAEVPTSPISQAPSSPTSTMGRPSSTTSLTKKEVKQLQKEERNLIKELEKVDKMVRKHDEKAIKARKKAEEKQRKEEKKQKKDTVNHRQISAPIAVTVMPASQALHSPISIEAEMKADRVTHKPITTPSPLEEIRNSSFDESSFPRASHTEPKSVEPLFIEPKRDQVTQNIKKKKPSLDSADTEPTYQDEDTYTLGDQQDQQLPQLSKAAPRISLLPNTVASLSLFDSLYKEVDAMESSFDMQYPVEAQERRKSIASSSAPQSPQSPKFL